MQTEIEEIPKKVPSKRGRKRKEVTSDTLAAPPRGDNIVMIIEEVEPTAPQAEDINPETGLKKRGRKPKGGKIVAKKEDTVENSNQIPNVILHLKCSMQDLSEHNEKMNKIFTNPLSYNPSIPPNIMTYDMNNTQSFSIYENINNDDLQPTTINATTLPTHTQFKSGSGSILAYDDVAKFNNSKQILCSACNEKVSYDNVDDTDVSVKDINIKLKNLKMLLYKNANLDKKSACFWCTYDYDNQPCYIPKYELDGELYGYGSFCRPECAVAYLMKENIDDSMKFERYHLLNQIYSKVYNFKKNIKPAPNPHFLLEKFYGNLTIQEYRKLLKTEHMLLVVEKPMTLILPELHDDNDDFVMNIYGGKTVGNQTNTGNYKVKKQSEKNKGPTKNSIMKENFGF